MPFQVLADGGIVKEIRFQKNDPAWSRNLKRNIAFTEFKHSLMDCDFCNIAYGTQCFVEVRAIN